MRPASSRSWSPPSSAFARFRFPPDIIVVRVQVAPLCTRWRRSTVTAVGLSVRSSALGWPADIALDMRVQSGLIMLRPDPLGALRLFASGCRPRSATAAASSRALGSCWPASLTSGCWCCTRRRCSTRWSARSRLPRSRWRSLRALNAGRLRYTVCGILAGPRGAYASGVRPQWTAAWVFESGRIGDLRPSTRHRRQPRRTARRLLATPAGGKLRDPLRSLVLPCRHPHPRSQLAHFHACSDG